MNNRTHVWLEQNVQEFTATRHALPCIWTKVGNGQRSNGLLKPIYYLHSMKCHILSHQYHISQQAFFACVRWRPVSQPFSRMSVCNYFFMQFCTPIIINPEISSIQPLKHDFRVKIENKIINERQILNQLCLIQTFNFISRVQTIMLGIIKKISV